MAVNACAWYSVMEFVNPMHQCHQGLDWKSSSGIKLKNNDTKLKTKKLTDMWDGKGSKAKWPEAVGCNLSLCYMSHPRSSCVGLFFIINVMSSYLKLTSSHIFQATKNLVQCKIQQIYPDFSNCLPNITVLQCYNTVQRPTLLISMSIQSDHLMVCHSTAAATL